MWRMPDIMVRLRRELNTSVMHRDPGMYGRLVITPGRGATTAGSEDVGCFLRGRMRIGWKGTTCAGMGIRSTAAATGV